MNSPVVEQIIAELHNLSDEAIAEHSQRFFKTGPGEYGEGDKFLGIRVPVIRKCVKKWRALDLADVGSLLNSVWHEVRLLALLIMVDRFSKGDHNIQQEIYTTYLHNTDSINNWDLVDCSAHHIVGSFLLNGDRTILRQLAHSDTLWERRLAIMATLCFIRRGWFSDTLLIAELLRDDPHDLIHKAVGWMLREVGKRDLETEVSFLKKQYKQMPRTMLRYAIEHFPEPERKLYLKGTI
jgi:3-methyladenine DNA glycosylase AlkD